MGTIYLGEIASLGAGLATAVGALPIIFTANLDKKWQGILLGLGGAVTGAEHITTLANSFSTYAKHVREAIDATEELGDADTADLYTEISRTIDKRLWFLEAHLA